MLCAGDCEVPGSGGNAAARGECWGHDVRAGPGAAAAGGRAEAAAGPPHPQSGGQAAAAAVRTHWPPSLAAHHTTNFNTTQPCEGVAWK